MSQDSNPFLTPTKVVEPPSTPKAALLTCSPPRPSKTATVQRGLLFSPIIPTSLDFVTSSTPSRLPRSPQRSPKKISNDADKENSPPKLPALPSTLLERIALASPGAGTPQLGKRRASNTPADTRSSKRSRDGPTACPEDDSEAECEEVQRCLLQPTTPDPAGRRLQTAFAVFGTAPRAPVAVLRGERSPSPTPQQSVRKRRRKGVFMDAVEVPQRRVVSLLLHPSGASLSPSASSSSTPLPPPSSLISLHPSSEAAAALPSTPPPPPLPASLPPHGPTVRRSLRRAKSLVLGLGPQSMALTPAQRKRQNPLLAKRRRKTAADSYEPAAIASESSSSPISASLKRARMLVGSDDSMAADIDLDYLPPPESSDDDLHLGQRSWQTLIHLFEEEASSKGGFGSIYLFSISSVALLYAPLHSHLYIPTLHMHARAKREITDISNQIIVTLRCVL
ncbi:hypothetical protein EDB89DRAFT_2073865 [Lactarius sanguifluus]|nr:hypothetical protein EDB89DRAFT_2073865 [Lactarius sanguifluus]